VILRYDRDAESGREASIPASGHSKRPRSGLWSGPRGSTLSVRLGISAESPCCGPIDVGGDNRLDAATSHGAQSMPTPCRPAADECAPFHVSPSNHALYSEINIALYRRRRIKAGWNWSMTALGPHVRSGSDSEVVEPPLNATACPKGADTVAKVQSCIGPNFCETLKREGSTIRVTSVALPKSPMSLA
jgi:hypothetical protein